MSAAQESSLSPLGIIAGGGMLPGALVERCVKSGRRVAVIALEGFANVDDFSPYLRTNLPLGKGRKIIRFFHEHDVRDVVMIGSVARPSWWEIKPDWWTIWTFGRIMIRGGLGDDGLLRLIRRVLENQGFLMHGVQDFLPEMLAGDGPIGSYNASAHDETDIARGFKVAKKLGEVDVGQSVVVQNGLVLGVEGVEGTDALIERCGKLKRAGPGPILVKTSKPNQDAALDLPTVGPKTLARALTAGFRGIAVESGLTLVVEPATLIAQADASNFFIVGRTFAD